jgi:hypothetical protein
LKWLKKFVRLLCLIHFGIITIQRHLNQYYDSLERPSPYKDGGLEEEMRAVTIKALISNIWRLESFLFK